MTSAPSPLTDASRQYSDAAANCARPGLHRKGPADRWPPRRIELDHHMVESVLVQAGASEVHVAGHAGNAHDQDGAGPHHVIGR